MHVKPIESPELREILVKLAGVTGISNEIVDEVYESPVVLVLRSQINQNCRRHDIITEMVMMIIVARIAEI